MCDVLPRLSTLRTALVARLNAAKSAWPPRLADWRAQVVALYQRVNWAKVWRAARPVAIFAGAYLVAWSYLYVATFLGAQPPPAPLFPPGAVLLCALILTPPRRWWLYLATAFMLQVPILAYLHLPLAWNLAGIVPDALEPLIAVGLMRLVLVLPPRFATLREVSLYTLCVGIGVAVGATLGAAVNAGIGGQAYWSSWLTWFLGDFLANLVLAPTLLLWMFAGFQGLRAGSRQRYAEAGVLYGGLILLGLLSFETHFFGPAIAGGVLYLPVPLLLWAAVRFGPRGLTTALALLALLAIPVVADNIGPFAGQSITDQTLLGRIFELQLFLLVIGVPLLFLAAQIYDGKRMDAALRASEAEYRSVVEAQTELITRYKPDTTVTFVNEANCRSMGLPREKMLGASLMDLIPELAHVPVRAMIRSLVAHPGVATIEHEVRRADGSLGWEQWVNRTILDEQGRVREIQGIGRDITERKRAEEALQISEARFRTAFTSAMVGIVLVDTAGHPLEVNRPYAEMMGYSEEEMHSLTFMDFTHPDDLEPNLTLFRRALAGEIDSYQLEKRYIHKQGYVVWGVLSVGVVRDADGRALYFVCHIEDITERKRLELERAAQEEQLDRVFEAMGEAVLVYNDAGNVVRTNEAARRLLRLDTAPTDFYQLSAVDRLALYAPRDEQRGELLTPEDWLVTRALRGDVLAGKEARDIRMRALDGRELEVGASVAPMHDPEGKIVGAVLILSDRTERNRLAREREEARAAEQATREMNQRLDVFATLAAHDLQGPTSSSRMVVAAAQRELRLSTEQAPLEPARQAQALDRFARALTTAQNNLERLWQLTQQLLDVSRARSGLLALNREPHPLADLVGESVEAQRLLAPGRTITLDLPEPPSPPMLVNVDPSRLTQALNNYLSNAVRYSSEDESIEVSLRVVAERAEGASDDLVWRGRAACGTAGTNGTQSVARDASGGMTRYVARVEVRDHGAGISPEDQQTIWDRFQRGREVKEAKGLGLGLYVARTMVELHGGRVGVESTVGEGSTFWFTVPLIVPPADIDESPSESDDPDAAA
jgi:PAS domain S-box-containing protein